MLDDQLIVDVAVFPRSRDCFACVRLGLRVNQLAQAFGDTEETRADPRLLLLFVVKILGGGIFNGIFNHRWLDRYDSSGQGRGVVYLYGRLSHAADWDGQYGDIVHAALTAHPEFAGGVQFRRITILPGTSP